MKNLKITGFLKSHEIVNNKIINYEKCKLVCFVGEPEGCLQNAILQTRKGTFFEALTQTLDFDEMEEAVLEVEFIVGLSVDEVKNHLMYTKNYSKYNDFFGDIEEW